MDRLRKQLRRFQRAVEVHTLIFTKPGLIASSRGTPHSASNPSVRLPQLTSSTNLTSNIPLDKLLAFPPLTCSEKRPQLSEVLPEQKTLQRKSERKLSTKDLTKRRETYEPEVPDSYRNVTVVKPRSPYLPPLKTGPHGGKTNRRHSDETPTSNSNKQPEEPRRKSDGNEPNPLTQRSGAPRKQGPIELYNKSPDYSQIKAKVNSGLPVNRLLSLQSDSLPPSHVPRGIPTIRLHRITNQQVVWKLPPYLKVLPKDQARDLAHVLADCIERDTPKLQSDEKA